MSLSSPASRRAFATAVGLANGATLTILHVIVLWTKFFRESVAERVAATATGPVVTVRGQ